MIGRPGGLPHAKGSWDCTVEQVSDLLIPEVSDSRARPDGIESWMSF